MRYILTLMIILCAAGVKAQNDDGLLTAKKLAMDTTISGAVAFNADLLSCLTGYTFKFVDKTVSSEQKYIYEHVSHETLKLEYTYRQRSTDSNSKPRPIVFAQRITADDKTIVQIYGCIFGETIMTQQLEAYSGAGLGFVYMDRDYHYSLMPDDYKPGYWVLTITE